MTKQITDNQGRVGVITDDRGDVLFARPVELPYLTKDTAGVTGVHGAVLITATAWHRQADGTYAGLWADSPLNTRLTATVSA